MGHAIVVIEDERLLARNLGKFLERQGYEVFLADGAAAGLQLCREMVPDVVLVDYNLPDGNGVDVIRQLRAQDSNVRLVMTTSYGDVRIAVDAMKAGADDYLTKPIALEELGIFLERLLAQAQMRDSLAYYRRREMNRSGLDRIIGESPAMLSLKGRIRQILEAECRLSAAPPAPLLIIGETGTGKELIARALHFDGPRASGPFVELNCAALPSHLVESELFGHEKGAFTDAKERRDGLFKSADGGTLFLDEIGEMPLDVQAKLLKVLEDRQVRPIGGVRSRSINVRLVAATNAALEDKIASGEFRRDLYFRLAVLALKAPPLRDRGADVTLLAEGLLAESARKYGRVGLRLSSEAQRALERHSWPGNVRELRNVVEQATLFCIGDEIRTRDLHLLEPPIVAPVDHGQAADPTSLPNVERNLIVQALSRLNGNVTLAARELGISRDTLRYRMERHGLRRERFV
ncbi:MAG: sigma-54 dependent transcriptional regulator [Dongiaceae bacterium]